MGKALISIASAILLFVVGMPTSAFLGWLSGTDVCSIILWSISSILIVLCVYIIIKKEYKKLLYAGPFAISLIALSFFFGNRYSDYEAKGDCLFRPSAPLYTKWGKCVIEDFGDFEYISDDDSHDLSRWDFHIQSEAENAVNGPYFYKMEKLTVDLDDEGESYSYDDSYDKVYYDYKAYDVEYKFSIYNSKGDWAGEHSVSEYFFYFPDKKVIDGTSYKYEMNGEDFRTSWKFADKLHESVKSQLHDYIVEMAENLAQQTTIVGNSPSAPVDNPSSYTEETRSHTFHKNMKGKCRFRDSMNVLVALEAACASIVLVVEPYIILQDQLLARSAEDMADVQCVQDEVGSMSLSMKLL